MKNEPNIRIKGFEGEWKECTFNNLVDRISSYSSSKSLPTVEFEDIISGENRLNKDVYSKPIHKGGIAFEKNDVLFGKLRPYLKNILFATFNGIAVGDFWVLRANESYPAFVYTLVNNKSFMDVANISSGSKMPRADWNLVSKHKFLVPSFFEQRAIATYFRHLDSLIEIADKKVASLKQVKEASLQSMFPKEGQKVPEVRFKGFEGEWKNCILSDIATFSKGHGYSKNDLTNEKDATPIILYGRMYTKYESIITRVETFANLLPNSVLSEGNEVIVPGSGETAEDISVASAICTKGIIIGGDLNILKPKEGIFAPFLALNITYSHAHYELSTKAQGKTIVHLHNDDFKDVHVSYPSLPEQRKIASFFVHLDKQIAIAQQRLDLLRRIKSACLDGMFV